MTVRIKICGITNAEDALASVEAGADALGFVLYRESPRYIPLKKAEAILEALPPYITSVAVVADAKEEYLDDLLVAGFDLLQFQGEEGPEVVDSYSSRAVKAIRVRGAESLASIGRYRVRAYLLDASAPGQLGGTGRPVDRRLAAEGVKKGTAVGVPVILAGGLTPENVASAIREVRPFAVDVATGVESAPGRKDPKKVRRFIEEARRDDAR